MKISQASATVAARHTLHKTKVCMQVYSHVFNIAVLRPQAGHANIP